MHTHIESFIKKTDTFVKLLHAVNSGPVEVCSLQAQAWAAERAATFVAMEAARSEVRRLALPLAADLERVGMDSAPVLLVGDAAERGGGIGLNAWAGIRVDLQRLAILAVSAQSRGKGTQSSKPKGRLPKADSEARRYQMLAIVRQHASLKDAPRELAARVGTTEKTVRRWLAQEDQKYRDSKPAKPAHRRLMSLDCPTSKKS